MDFVKRIVTAYKDAKLEALLVQWAHEYGYGPADYLGYGRQNTLYRLERHAGYLPPPEPVRAPVRTEADRVERIVADMEGSGMWKHAKVLRLDYFRPNDAMDSRLDRLRKIGIMCSKSGYDGYLGVAKEHIRISLKEYKKRA